MNAGQSYGVLLVTPLLRRDRRTPGAERSRRPGEVPGWPGPARIGLSPRWRAVSSRGHPLIADSARDRYEEVGLLGLRGQIRRTSRGATRQVCLDLEHLLAAEHPANRPGPIEEAVHQGECAGMPPEFIRAERSSVPTTLAASTVAPSPRARPVVCGKGSYPGLSRALDRGTARPLPGVGLSTGRTASYPRGPAWPSVGSAQQNQGSVRRGRPAVAPAGS